MNSLTKVLEREKNDSSPETAPWSVSSYSWRVSTSLGRSAPPVKPSSCRIGTFAWSFPPICMLIHPVACVLLDRLIFFFFSILLWEEITFSGLNSHLISFIFNQALHPFLSASFFPRAPSHFSGFRLGPGYCARVFPTRPGAATVGAGNLA